MGFGGSIFGPTFQYSILPLFPFFLSLCLYGKGFLKYFKDDDHLQPSFFVRQGGGTPDRLQGSLV